MGEQTEKKFTWVLKKFSSLQQDERCYSRPFAVAGCNWHLFACRKGDRNDGHLSLYLELADPASLPPGWTRDVKFTLTLVSKGWGKSNIVLGAQRCFNAKDTGWGITKFVSLTKLHAKDEGFLVNNKLIILAELHVLPAVVVPEETVKIIEPPSNIEGNQASDASDSESQGDSSCQVGKKTENAFKENLDDDDASEEGLDDDDDEASEEGSGDDGSCEENVDDASSPVSDDGLEGASHTVGNHGS